MNKESLYKFLNRKKEYATSPVRRIEKVFPVKDERLAALIIDCTQKQGESGIAAGVDALLEKGAGFSILVDGDAFNYHHKDLEHAAEKKIGFINGGFTGRPYTLGKEARATGRPVYEKAELAAEDLIHMHNCILEDFGQDTYLAYPPYGLDIRRESLDLYDILDMADHDYLKGSMHIKASDVPVLTQLLTERPHDLNGQIIYMPLSDIGALEPVWELLEKACFRFCSAKELLSKSPFEDIGPDESYFVDAKRLLEEGYPIAYRNNKFCPKPYMVAGELAMTIAPKEVRAEKYERIRSHKYTMEGKSLRKPYTAPLAFLKRNWLKLKPDFPVTSIILSRALETVGVDIRWKKRRYQYHRWELMPVLAKLLIDDREERRTRNASMESLISEAAADSERVRTEKKID